MAKTPPMLSVAKASPIPATNTNSYELAMRVQLAAPELMDLSRESKDTLEMYGAEPGKSSFANSCLLARRLVERGVRCFGLGSEDWEH